MRPPQSGFVQVGIWEVSNGGFTSQRTLTAFRCSLAAKDTVIAYIAYQPELEDMP
jgi:hypothetical protein